MTQIQLLLLRFCLRSRAGARQPSDQTVGCSVYDGIRISTDLNRDNVRIQTPV